MVSSTTTRPSSSTGVVVWGSNTSGQQVIPGALSGLDLVAVAAGSGDCVVLDATGTVHAWGDDGEQQVSGADGFTSTILISASGSNIGLIHQELVVDCPADFDQSGAVDGADLTRLLADWGTSSTVSDLVVDGVVDGADLTVLLSEWGGC